MCLNVFPACMYVQHMSAWCPWSSEDGTGSLKLELRIVVSCHVVLGTDLEFFVGTSALNLFEPFLQPQTILS